MVQIPVDKRYYDNEWKCGRIDNQKAISSYSVSADRQIHNDCRNAGYLIDEEKMSESLPFDLKIGHEKFIQKDKEVTRNEPALHMLCKWALSQQRNASAKEVFAGADFATWKGTLKRMAYTLLEHNYARPNPKHTWSVHGQKIGGVILLGEQDWKFYNNRDLGTFSGFKFEQYMTAKTPGGEPNTDEPVDIRPTFEMMVASNLTVCSETLKLCCGGEIDALRDGVPVELKTSFLDDDRRFNIMVSAVMQCELMGVTSVLTGIKDNSANYCVHKVVERTVEEVKSKELFGKNEGDGTFGSTTAKCYGFLFAMLKAVKEFLETNEACDIFFDPSRGVVEIAAMSRQEANANGRGASDEFLRRFNV